MGLVRCGQHPTRLDPLPRPGTFGLGALAKVANHVSSSVTITATPPGGSRAEPKMRHRLNRKGLRQPAITSCRGVVLYITVSHVAVGHRQTRRRGENTRLWSVAVESMMRANDQEGCATLTHEKTPKAHHPSPIVGVPPVHFSEPTHPHPRSRRRPLPPTPTHTLVSWCW